MAQDNRWRGVLAGVIGVLVLLANDRAKSVEAVRLEPYGRFTAKQIIARTERLPGIVHGRTAGMRLSAERIETGGLRGNQHRHWVVDATGEAAAFIGHFDWDADTGELLSASFPLPPATPRGQAELKAAEALRLSWHWMRALGVAERSPSWQAVGVPQRTGGAWRVYLRGKDRTVAVTVYALSGDLITLMSTPSKLNG
jgi:hypothetical protein